MAKKLDSIEYHNKKRSFDKVLTIYGRKAVLEALTDLQLIFHSIHLADSNKTNNTISDILGLATSRQIEVRYHDRKSLSRISKNGKQDQGVAADIICSEYQRADEFLAEKKWNVNTRLLALDGITNPKNLGMIIRTVCAGNIDALLFSEKGNAEIGPLTIKASAGTVFRSKIVRCNSLLETLQQYQRKGFELCTLSTDANSSLFKHQTDKATIYILGNESDGVSKEIKNLANHQLNIPMLNGVESLNVAITAALIAYNNFL